jgi:hypothetical protein
MLAANTMQKTENSQQPHIKQKENISKYQAKKEYSQRPRIKHKDESCKYLETNRNIKLYTYKVQNISLKLQ